jgi:predicted permease
MTSQDHKAQFNIVAGALVAFLGVLFTPIGMIGVYHEGLSGIGLVLLGLLLSALLMITGGVFMIIQGRNDINQAKEVKAKIKAGKSPVSEESILGQWDIDEATWEAFAVNERKYRNSDNLWFFIAFVMLGTLVVMTQRSSVFIYAFTITVAIALIMVFVRRGAALNKLRISHGAHKFVIITHTEIILNGKRYPINDGYMHAEKAQLLPNENPAILEITLYWRTRGGNTFDELRIPVPAHALEQAGQLTSKVISITH